MGIDGLAKYLAARLGPTFLNKEGAVGHPGLLWVIDVQDNYHITTTRRNPEDGMPVPFDVKDPNVEQKLKELVDNGLTGKIHPKEFIEHLMKLVPSEAKCVVLVSDEAVRFPAKDMERCQRKACSYEPVVPYSDDEIVRFTDLGFIRPNGTEDKSGITMRSIVANHRVKVRFHQWMCEKFASTPNLIPKGIDLYCLIEGVPRSKYRSTDSVIIREPCDLKLPSDIKCPESDVLIPMVLELHPESRVVVCSNDSDLIPILIYRFGDKLANDEMKISLYTRFGVHYLNEVAQELKKERVSYDVFMGGCILLGTDFYRKKWTTNRLGVDTIMNAIFMRGNELANNWNNNLEQLLCLIISYHFTGKKDSVWSLEEARKQFVGSKKKTPLFLEVTAENLSEVHTEVIEFRNKPIKRLLEGESREENVREKVTFRCVPLQRFWWNLKYWQTSDMNMYKLQEEN